MLQDSIPLIVNSTQINQSLMSYLNQDSYSRDNEYSGFGESQESQAGFLKLKLLETHSKLIKQLELSKQLEEELENYRQKYQNTQRQLDSTTKKYMAATSKAQTTKYSAQKCKQMESMLLQSQKKNDLLRVDLDSMRNKILAIMANKNDLQEKVQEHDRIVNKINQKNNNLMKQMKIKEVEHYEFAQQVQRYKAKYDKQVQNNQQIQAEINQLKKEIHQLNQKYQFSEMNYRQEKERNNKLVNQMHLCQKQLKQCKSKYESLNSQAVQFKDQLYLLKNKVKNEQRTATQQLQKLTSQYNNLHALYRLKQKELQGYRRKPLEQASKKKANYQNTKQLVNKLEREETNIKQSARYSSKAKTPPPRSYKEEKQQYLTMIEEVGTMQSAMFQCNIQKKKILAQIDKIDETRVKTKEMIARRRRLEVQLQNQDKKIEHVKMELKKMKVM